jgi:glutathione S-transferase
MLCTFGWTAARASVKEAIFFGDFTIADAMYAPVVSRFIT